MSSVPPPAPVLGRRVALVGAALALTGALVTTAVGLSGSERADGVGALCAGLLTAVWCAALAHGARARRGRPRSTEQRAQQLMALAGLVWSCGRVSAGLHHLLGRGGGHLLVEQHASTVASSALVVAAVLLATGATGTVGRRRTLGLDGLAVGAAVAAVLWLLWFQRLDLGSGFGPAVQHAGALTVLALSTLVAVGALAALAALDVGLAVAAVGCALLGAGQLAAAVTLLGAPGAPSWLTTAVLGLTWPLVLWACARAGRWPLRVRLLRRSDAAVRSGAVTAAAAVGSTVAAVVLTAGAGGRYLDATSGALVCLVALLGALRELVLRRHRAALVLDLSLQVLTDELTGLPNRRAAVERLLCPDAAWRHRSTVAVKVGLDCFYEFNAQFGVAAGDDALRAVAGALGAVAPPGWAVHRLGGDQFLLWGPGDLDAGAACAEAARDAVRALPAVGDAPLTASAGVAAIGPAAADPTAVLTEAAAALRDAKAEGDDSLAVHDAALAARTRRQHLVTAALRDALAGDRITAHLQPVVDIRTGATTGFELLSRWDDPVLGRVAPDEFVGLAESTGLVHRLGASVLRNGLRAHTAAGGVERRLRVAVNASVQELRWPGYVEQLRATATEAGVPLDLLTVEVTESLFLHREGPAASALHELAAAGVKIAIDDFGTGYSSLSYLERLPVSYVKVDRSLVVAAAGGERSRALLGAVVAVSRSLGLQVVAEGIEDEQQARMVSDLGIELGQGWWWARALAPADVAAHLAAQPRPLAPAPAPGPGVAADRGR